MGERKPVLTPFFRNFPRLLVLYQELCVAVRPHPYGLLRVGR